LFYAGKVDARALAGFIFRHPRLFILTGAGCSTGSGIPDYRDADGQWKRAQPVSFQAFMRDHATRQRYWARSLAGWGRFSQAGPNAAHTSLAHLERLGRVELLVTQNVDRLHQAAGSMNVVDLHGRLDRVRCTTCGWIGLRHDLQRLLEAMNPHWTALEARIAPDGDADLEQDFSTFEIPDCSICGGILKPDVVFFGEGVPRDRVELAMTHLRRADAMLVVGSSLMVYSGFRFAQTAADLGLPIAALNLGRTRADDLLQLKVSQPCTEALARVIQAHEGGVLTP
jgi:NAD-dependent SIR2 family protein deacetylase